MAPRTTEQFEAIRQDRRKAIIEAALQLFAEKGFAATKIEMITKAAGISKGLFYNYFESKESLLKEVANLLFIELGEVVELVYTYQTDKDNPKQLLKEALNLFKQSIQIKKDFWKLYARLTFQLEGQQLMESVMEEEVKYNQALARIFEDLGFENALIEAIKFNNLIDGIVMNYILRADYYPLEEIFENIQQMYDL